MSQRVVLLGSQGSGKTTFFNRITNSTEPTKNSGKSCTRQIVTANTKYGNGFHVVDTPGFESDEEKIVHIAGILAALTYGNVNRILVIVKWDCRDKHMTRPLDAVIKPIHRFIELVTVVVTHWDNCQTQQEDEVRIQQLVKQKYKTDSVLFVSTINDQPKDICLQIVKIIYQFQNEKQIVLFEQEIFKYFDFLEFDEDSDGFKMLEKQQEELSLAFRKEAQKYHKLIMSLNSSDQYFLDILHFITNNIKEVGQNFVSDYEKKNGQKILNLADKLGNNISYLHYILLKKAIQKEINTVIEKALERMKTSQKHFFNFLRKCEFCGEVWLKVTGCDNETICGERVYDSFDDEDWMVASEKQKIELITNQNGELIVNVKQVTSVDRWLNLLNRLFQFEDIKKAFKNISQLEEVLLKMEPKESILSYVIQNRRGLLNLQYDLLEFQAFDSDLLCLSQHQFGYSRLFQRHKQTDKKGRGCGKEIDWKNQPLLKIEEIKDLFSTELLDYFADEESLMKKEVDYLNQTYKDIVIGAIKKESERVKKLQ